MDEQEKVKFRVMESGDFEQTVDLCSQLFVNHEPITKSLKINYQEFRRFLEPYLFKAIEDRLSIVATDANAQIVGFVISKHLMAIPLYIQEISHKFEPIHKFLESLEYTYFAKYQYWEAWQTLHILLLGVKEEYKNQKIATNLLKENLRLARLNYFSVAISEATGIKSQNVFRKVGFQEEVTLPYDSYIFQGKKIFSSIQESPSCKLMSYRLR